MGTVALISMFSAAILTTVAIWNRKYKLGRYFDAQGKYILPKDTDKKFYRVPDVSFKKLVGKMDDKKD